MLEELKILNGTIDLKFDKLNNIYTLSVSSNVEKLEFEYKITEGYNIEVIDNYLDEDINNVYIKVYNDSEENIYTFIVYKESSYTSSLIDDYKNSLNVKENNVDSKIIYSIIIGCIIVIIIFGIILLKPRKRSK